jgi:hypothetical protein
MGNNPSTRARIKLSVRIGYEFVAEIGGFPGSENKAWNLIVFGNLAAGLSNRKELGSSADILSLKKFLFDEKL